MVTVLDIHKEVAAHSSVVDRIRDTPVFVKEKDGVVRRVDAIHVTPHPVTGEVGVILFTSDQKG